MRLNIFSQLFKFDLISLQLLIEIKNQVIREEVVGILSVELLVLLEGPLVMVEVSPIQAKLFFLQ